MKYFLILTVLLIFFDSKASKASCTKKPIIVYSENSEDINIYHCGFDGIEYIKFINAKKGYSLICELNKFKRFSLWKYYRGEVASTYNAIVDTTNGIFIGLNGAEYVKRDDFIQLVIIRISDLEIDLLNKSIEVIKTYNSKRFDLNLKSVLFFSNYVPKRAANIW